MLLNHSRELRKNQTKAEDLLWMFLRARRFNGYKFKRQQIIGRYIVDFVCFEKRIIVELDGGHHAVQTAADEVRKVWLESQGFQVLRLWNNEILVDVKPFLEILLKALQER